MDIEKRKHKRYKFNAFIYKENSALLGYASDISLKGCFIKTDSSFRTYDTVNISFILPHSLEKVTADCEIMRRDENGIGTMFKMDQKNKKLILNFIKHVSKENQSAQLVS